MNRKKIEDIIIKLLEISQDYDNFEIALAIFLRSDLEMFKTLTNEQLEEIEDLVKYNDSFLDVDKEDIDEIIGSEEEED